MGPVGSEGVLKGAGFQMQTAGNVRTENSRVL